MRRVWYFPRPASRFATTRRISRVTAGALILAAVLSGSHGVPARADGDCVPTSPQEMINAALAYVSVYRDLTLAPQAPLAPDIRRAELPAVLPREQGGPITAKNREDVIAFLRDSGGCASAR